jgi:predicted  nucleic acid-binding Zn-ribbon protein
MHETHLQHFSIDASDGQLLQQRCHHQRKELARLGSKLSAERNEHKRQMQQMNEELQRHSHEATKLRETVESYTRQKLILQPQQDLRDDDIAFKYQDHTERMWLWATIPRLILLCKM